MPFDLSAFHRRKRTAIIDAWVARLKTDVGEEYARRPRAELYETVTRAFESFHQVLIYNDYGHIDRFINKITKMRLESGFRLSRVQQAFELYRDIVPPLLAREKTDLKDFHSIITKINQCLSYTIHRFSDHFQAMHEKEIIDHNQRLEREVETRTAALQQSELKYKTLVEEIHDGYFVIQDERIVFANQAFCQMHGYTVEEVVGRGFQFFVDPRDLDEVEHIYTKGLRRKGSPRVFEYLRRTKDGHSFPTEILAKITRYDQRLSSIGICRDITGRVKMEKRIREAERMAYIGQITTSLSHEIRNPLSAVKLNLQILKKNDSLQGNDRRRIDISIDQVIRLERILRELLDFAKPLQMEWRPYPLKPIIDSTLELLEMNFRQREVAVATDLAADAPPLKTDKDKLRQALINLLLNAAEASRPGQRIRVRTRPAPDGAPAIDIEIADRGPGVSDEISADIFKPFFTTKSKGTGLGLGMVHRIARAHGGSLTAGNRPGGGARFTLRLPL